MRDPSHVRNGLDLEHFLRVSFDLVHLVGVVPVYLVRGGPIVPPVRIVELVVRRGRRVASGFPMVVAREYLGKGVAQLELSIECVSLLDSTIEGAKEGRVSVVVFRNRGVVEVLHP